MNKNLEFIARNGGKMPLDALCAQGDADRPFCGVDWFDSGRAKNFYGAGDIVFDVEEIIQARVKLGLKPSGFSENDEEECLQLAYERMNKPKADTVGKQIRYQDAKGEDWIDEFARTATMDEFRGAMRFTIGKYNRRAGKKDDLISEIEKMRDYCDRWIAYEKERA